MLTCMAAMITMRTNPLRTLKPSPPIPCQPAIHPRETENDKKTMRHAKEDIQLLTF
jgi:hypothetical protein